jgi:hypothetical protein
MRATIRLLSRSTHLPTASPTEAANPMRTSVDTYLLMDVPTNFKKSGRIFKVFSVKFKKYQRILPTELIIIISWAVALNSVDKSVSIFAV